jgi:hypothetical protein
MCGKLQMVPEWLILYICLDWSHCLIEECDWWLWTINFHVSETPYHMNNTQGKKPVSQSLKMVELYDTMFCAGCGFRNWKKPWPQ